MAVESLLHARGQPVSCTSHTPEAIDYDAAIIGGRLSAVTRRG